MPLSLVAADPKTVRSGAGLCEIRGECALPEEEPPNSPIEQYALHFSRMRGWSGGNCASLRAESGNFRTHEYFDGVTHGDRADLERAHEPTVGGAISASAPSVWVVRPTIRLFAPTNPATNGVCGR